MSELYHNQKNLMRAAEDGDYEKALDCITKGVSPNCKDGNGWSVLHIASSNGNENVVKLLLDQGAIVNDTNYFGNTVLHLAARYGHENIVKLLLDKVANIDDKN
eukprot:CAMPEP_0184693138 /NCGR_PEP_ID=MMETSP0313-20130426/1420_1 /TAXON_ID=2792 /ORGANISM="Porphyridium aerugineum, Strain SAG 1380-2" /LENGTH=103 /DNA_ID=CAMNT_0027151111 /DNA_START=269 /DNA_END=577 /DNA_ORIENTATION=-